MTAIEAWTHFQATGESPLSRWQSHLLLWDGEEDAARAPVSGWGR